ncbi:MAG: DNA gyrase inhibitor YacG [Deltaproteobacteria bacterium]|nr:DNA gyrase inhibitor YacG [Deltaproteobacteria bacterium]
MEVPCPTCRTKTAWEGNPFRPFCSERCKLLDLSKWLAEEYRIPASDDEVSELDEAEDPVH